MTDKLLRTELNIYDSNGVVVWRSVFFPEDKKNVHLFDYPMEIKIYKIELEHFYKEDNGA